jgi:hypothetical protein
VAALALPAVALAQGSGTPVLPGQGPSNALTPFNNPAPIPTQAPPTVNPVTTSTTGGGLNGTDGVAIGIGAMLVLGGISFFIWRDARKRAPVRQHAATAAAGGGSGPRQRPQKSRKLSPAEKRRRKRGKAR